MRKWRAWLVRFGELFRKERGDRDLAAEMESHLQMHIEDNLRAGMSAAEARREAIMKLGGVEQTKEIYRDRRGLPLLETLFQDLRFAGRMLLKNPGFTAIAVLTLVLGIGATTAIFSVVYGVLLRPLPYPNPDEIVQLWEVNAKGGRMNFPEPNFTDIRSASQTLEALAECNAGPFTITGGTEPTRTLAASVSRDFFKVMRVSPVLGRSFSPEDQREGAAPVLLVSHGYWRQHLGGSNELSKLKLVADHKVFSVAGVMPEGFRFPAAADLWIPRELYPPDNQSRTAHNWHVFGRVRKGVALSQARAELSSIAHRLKQQYGQDIDMTDAAADRLRDAMTSDIRAALLLLLGAVSSLLLVACANVANLLLAQATRRDRELAIRAALGADRRRLVWQFLIESALLCTISAIVGALAARWGVNALLALAPKNLPRLDAISLNIPVLLFTVGLSCVMAVALGTFTAMRATSGDVRDALAEGGREQIGGQRAQRFGQTIVAGQLAITLVLLVGAGLLGRSLVRVLSVEPGFRTEHVVTMDLTFAPLGDNDAVKVVQANKLNNLFTRLGALPGVEAVGGANALPLVSDFLADGTFLILNPRDVPTRMEDFEQLFHNPSITGYADYCVASEDYFRVLAIPLLRGRLFDDRDGLNSAHVAVINDALARTRWPNEDPLGKTIEFGNMDGDLRLLTIVGVVGDARNRSLEAPPSPTVYVNYRQRPQSSELFTIVMRTGLPPESVIPAAREIVRSIDPDVPPQFRTFAQVFTSSLAARRFNLTLVLAFAGTALLLAVAGIYGVMAYSVARRTREIGVRMALGAARGDVLRLVLGQGMWTTTIGVAIGIAGSLALTRTMQSLLFGVSPTDSETLAGVALLLAGVSMLACWIPTRRALRVDPIVALRYE
jgi:putative ABC transport system permease protein